MTHDYCPDCGQQGLPIGPDLYRCVDPLCFTEWALLTFPQPYPDDRRRVMTLMRALNMGTRRREGER
jgi:hypothetical protein